MPLDPRTLFAATIVFLLLMSFVSIGIWWTRRTHPGFGGWTVGRLLVVLALILLFLRSFVPDWISVICGNAVLIAGAVLFLEGTRAFYGMRPRLWSVYISAALAFLALAYFYYVQPNLNARVIDISLILGCLLILNVVALAKTPPAARTIGVSFTAITLGLGALSLIGRAVYFLLAPLYTDLFAPTWINGLFLCLAALAVAGFSVGVILLSDERLMNDLKGVQTKIVHANRELTEAIEHAKSMAERAARSDSAKSEFVAMISHEIRNPLAAIMATTELLLDTEMTQEQQDYLNAVNRAANALHALTDDALDLSRIEAGQLTIEAYRIDLHRIVADVSEIFSPAASKKGLELIVKYPPDLPYRFIGDAGRIRQVITNLAGNAIKFTARGYVRIDVDCKSQDAQQAKMRISVSDTGPGIPPQRIGAIFQAFGPVSKSASGKHTGTGMGLAISKRLADLMGGHLQVESELGRGSKFWFEVSLQLDHKSERTQSASGQAS